MARGLERFADDLAAHGISGLIVPDLPLEESDGVRAACDAAGIALVPLVAPTTPDERMARIGASARGFVYAVSVAGTTGERAALADAFAGHRRARQGRDRGAGRASGSASGRPSRRARRPTRAPTASSSAAGSCARRRRPSDRARPPSTSWWRGSRRP